MPSVLQTHHSSQAFGSRTSWLYRQLGRALVAIPGSRRRSAVAACSVRAEVTEGASDWDTPFQQGSSSCNLHQI